MSDIISSSFSTLSSSIYPPAIFQKTNGNFRIDQSMIKNRALIISIITGVGLALACLYSGQFIFLLPMGIVTALTTYLAIKKLEERRAHKAMHQLALEFFRDPHKEEVPAAAMKYILLSPKTVEELLETPQYLSKTSHKTGLNLLESSLSKNGYYTNQVYVKRLLICHHFTNKPFDQNIINSVLERPDLLSLLLQQDLLSPNDLTQDQQFLVWKHADHDLARLLKKKGFDPNQPNENGLTPILSSIYKKDLNQILFLIQHGADIPADDIKLIQKKTTYESFKLLVPTSISSKSEQEKGFKIPIRSEQETSSSSSSSEEQYEISLSEFLKNEPKILEALKKGRAKELQFMELEESKASLFSTESAIELSRFSIEVSNIHINLRTCLLAIPVIWALRISIVATGFSLLSCSIAIIGGLSLGAYRQWEISRATAKADEIALKELKLFQPTHRSIEYLASRKEVLLNLVYTDFQPFLSSSQEFFPITLLTELMYENKKSLPRQDRIFIFTQAIDKIFTRIDEDEKFELFLKALKHNFCVEHFLNNDKIQWDQLTKKQKNLCWQNLHDPKLIGLFIKKGFDPNHYFEFDLNDEDPKGAMLQRLKIPNYGFLKALIENGASVGGETVSFWSQEVKTEEDQAKLRLFEKYRGNLFSEIPA